MSLVHFSVPDLKVISNMIVPVLAAKDCVALTKKGSINAMASTGTTDCWKPRRLARLKMGRTVTSHIWRIAR